jgi:hypothetical protein
MINANSHTRLSLAVEKLSKDQTPFTIQFFAEVLAEYSDKSIWVAIPLENVESDNELVLFYESKKIYAGIYSDKPTPRFSGIITDINKLFQIVLSDDRIDGIVIDPESTQLYLEKKFLLHCLSLCKYNNYLPHASGKS